MSRVFILGIGVACAPHCFPARRGGDYGPHRVVVLVGTPEHSPSAEHLGGSFPVWFIGPVPVDDCPTAGEVLVAYMFCVAEDWPRAVTDIGRLRGAGLWRGPIMPASVDPDVPGWLAPYCPRTRGDVDDATFRQSGRLRLALIAACRVLPDGHVEITALVVDVPGPWQRGGPSCRVGLVLDRDDVIALGDIGEWYIADYDERANCLYLERGSFS